MPSPFPGMDPFLEDAYIFPDLHDSLIIHLKEAIQAKLPAKYYAITGNRIWLDVARQLLGPDVRVHQKNGSGTGSGSSSAGGADVLTKTDASPVRVTVPMDEVREIFVNVFAREDKGRRLVTSVEILSPTNKTSRDRGRKLYRSKQREMLRGQVNLVEIDLLRGGTHTTSVPLAHAVEKTGRFDYHVCVHRFDRPEDFFVYPMQLADPLPVIAIPLEPADNDVDIALQELFARIYDAGRYAAILNYQGRIPKPALPADKDAWVRTTLQEKGLGEN